MERERLLLSPEARRAEIIRLATTTRMTQEKIGERFGITQARISQILIAARLLRGRGTAPHRRRHEMLRLMRHGPAEEIST